MNRCNRCLLPEGKFNVVLNANGICNYCEYFEKKKKTVLDYADRDKILIRKLEKYQGKFEYDVIVGLSGGKDSTYVLYQLVNKYKLKVLAVTYDHGFLTDYARESIKNTVSKLKIDHYYYQPKWDIFRKFYKLTFRKLLDPCIACGLGGYFLAIKASYEKRIPFFIHGRTPFQMYRNFYKNSKDIFLPMMRLNLTENYLPLNIYGYFALLKKAPGKLIPDLIWKVRSNASVSPPAYRYVYGIINQFVREYVAQMAETEQEAKEIIDEFFVDSTKLMRGFVPEFLAYFLFEEYDEENIKMTLEKELDWKRPSSDNLLGHPDCALHDAAGYMYKALNDVDVLEPDIAVMLRFGKITRDQANKVIQANQPSEDNLEKSIDSVCSLCECSREDLKNILVTLKQANTSKFSSR
ncbi:MAG: hypothetical protein JW762_09030 [Dehalococcoidales bacterium]|nr:hypothetical protein [Dehalococcoidales bacterium]